MKKPKSLIEAEKARDEKQAEMKAAEQVAGQLKVEYLAALNAVTAAQVDADSSLPQCELWSVSRHTGSASLSSKLVIVRQTPTGILIVRRVGEQSGATKQYEFSKYCEVFRPKKQSDYYSSASFELRNVPAQFIPTK